MTSLERAVKDLQDSLIVISEIERRQSALLKEHSERIVQIESNLNRSAELQKSSDERMDSLIAIVDDIIRKRPPQ